MLTLPPSSAALTLRATVLALLSSVLTLSTAVLTLREAELRLLNTVLAWLCSLPPRPIDSLWSLLCELERRALVFALGE